MSAFAQVATEENGKARSDSTPKQHAYEWLQLPPFGLVRAYHQPPDVAERLVVFITGDGGFSPTMNRIEEMLAGHGYAVLSINIVPYLKHLKTGSAKCDYPAGDIENAAKMIEQRLGFSQYQQPLLIGYSSGATLVYAALAEAPRSFVGALSLGFCPDLAVSRPFCKGKGLTYHTDKHGYVFDPEPTLTAPWHVFLGDGDKVCDPAAMRDFTAKVPGAKFILLDKVGHGYKVWERWRMPFMTSIREVLPPPIAKQIKPPRLRASAGLDTNAAVPPPGDVTDLPLVEVPVKEGTAAPPDGGDLLAIVVSGDGGWASIDRDIAEELAAKGVPAVGLDSLKYFWQARTADEGAADLARVITHYREAWRRSRVVLIG